MTSSQLFILLVCTLSYGLIIGAYYGTIEYRIRNDLPLVTKDCFCPICNHKLSLLQQTPVLAWFALKGKCKYCHNSISPRYPAFEAAFGLFYVVSFMALRKIPLILLLLWLLFITAALALRAERHFSSLLKGLAIMYGYHILYGALLIILLS